ncbi:MAG: hypothetical protein BroJett011_34280 [Chloroflexota bacterium]|nr:MAG: hypothetical protein BroJett011_34280 [Chloroflexota bacterium]
MDDLKKNPEDEVEGNEVESPADGPMPDWMRLATSGGSGSSLTEENTPAWLKSIRSGQGFSKEKPTEPAQPAPPQSQASDDSMSDLERLLAEEGIDLNTVAEERPEGAGDMSARDWLIATSSEEIIRNKLGAQLAEEEVTPPAVPTSAPPDTPPSPSQALQASDDSLSDLERLLREEGIELGSVTEERPEGAGGMSARDWLISTSSEEIIRNKLGTQPVEEKPAPPPAPATPPPSPSLSDDKMVVEEDLPDWLQEIAADASEAEPSLAFDTELTEPAVPPEEGQFVVEEDLPDWLRDMAEEPVAIAEPEEPLTPAAPASFADDKMVVEEDLPDWLKDMAEEPAEGDIRTAPQVQTSPASSMDDGLVVEEDLPDWLREAAEPVAADLPIPEWTESAPAEADKMVVQEDLPDWLQEIAEEPALPAELNLTGLPVPALPFQAEDKTVSEEDLPDWLREAATDSVATPEPELPPAPPAPLSTDKMVVEEDLPDWLREVEVGSSESEVIAAPTELSDVVADLGEAEGDEDLPDWLREVEVSSLEDNLALPLVKPAAEAPSEADFTISTPLGDEELDLLDEEDLPAWLKEVQERNGQEPSDVSALPIGTPLDSSGLIEEAELPDWLREAQEETTPLAFEEGEPVAPEAQIMGDEALPDWLREEQFALDEPFEASEPSPETLIETVAESDMVVAEGLPDWLQEVQDETPEEIPLEAELPAPIPAVSPTRLDTDELVDEEGLPDWLREAAEAEEEAEPLLAEEAPVPVPVTGPPSLDVDVMVDEEGLPDWLREVAEAEEEAEPLGVEEAPSAPEPILIAGETVAVAVEAEEIEEAAPVEEMAEEEEIAPVSQPEPEPVAVSEPESVPAPSGIPDWLQKLRQVDEEEIVPVPVAPMPLPAPAAVARPVPQPVYAQAVAVPSPDIPADAEERLKRARTARDKGDINEAVGIYDSLVLNGVYLNKIIEDMQQTIKLHPGNYLLYQLMGDAMMRDGRLQSALNAYREALSKLS